MLNGFPDNFRMGDDEDVLNEFRQKQANFDLEEKRNEINNSRSLFIGALAGLAMAAIVGWFVLAPQYQSPETEEVPIIRRPQEEVKVPPVEPGNIDISNQENTVYDIIEKKEDSIEQIKILPQSEQPNADAIEALVEEVNAQEEAQSAQTSTGDEVQKESLVASGTMSNKSQGIEEKTEPKQTEKNQEKEEDAIKSAPQNQVLADAEQNAKTKPEAETKTVAKTEPKPATKAVAKTESKPATKAKTVASNAIAKGAWQIQLMSSPNKKAVEKSWQTMSSKYGVLSGLPHEISSADMGAKGTYYRLRAGNFATKAEAVALCNKLKAAGGSCFTARK